MKYLFILLASILSMTARAQQQEVVIIGTMHTVPGAVKHSYAPLLRRALKYKPEAILTEDNMPEDTMSIRKYTPNLLRKAEKSLATHKVDVTLALRLLSKTLSEMTHDDFETLSTYFLSK